MVHANVARKRNGCTALTMTGVTETGYLVRHSNSSTTTQLWMITTGTKQFYRTYGTGWAWSSITATVGGTAITSAVSFNKKLFLSNGGVGLLANRLWCIDGATLRTHAHAYMLTLGGSLPKISYLTRADRLFVGCAIIVFLGLLKAIIALVCIQRDAGNVMRRIDRLGRMLYPVAVLLVVASAVLL